MTLSFYVDDVSILRTILTIPVGAGPNRAPDGCVLRSGVYLQRHVRSGGSAWRWLAGLAVSAAWLALYAPQSGHAQSSHVALGDGSQSVVLSGAAEQAPDPDVASTGNIFPHRPGASHSYWDNLVGHLAVEVGITGNPWTRTGRNFAQFYADRANTVTMNQIIGSLSHPVENIGAGYGIGFTFETLYGSDGRFDPTLGMGSGSLNGLYQWVPTQAHIDVKFPWIFRNGIDVQVGQLYGLLGAEGTPATARPFYTFSYAADYIMPFEMLGVVATAHLSDRMDWILGVDAGNSTSFGRYGNNNKPKGYFGFVWKSLLGGRLDMHIIGHFGPQGNNGIAVKSPDGLWTSAGAGRLANSKMQYNADFLATYRINKAMSVTVDGSYLHDDLLRDDAYGVTTFFAYDLNPSLTLNARGEIFRDNTGGTITQYTSTTSFTRSISNKPYPYYSAPPTTYGELTVGVSYRPDFINRHSDFGQLTIRPEIRLDKSLNGTRPYNRAAVPSAANGYAPIVNNGTNNMLWFNCDAIWAF